MSEKSSASGPRPNHAMVTLVLAEPKAAWSVQPREEEVIGFTNCRVDAGALVFEFADGSLVAYGPGRWASVVTSHHEEYDAK